MIEDGIEYVDYVDEDMMQDIQMLVSRDLSEPYSIYTYRYFLHNWPKLCICAYAQDPDTAQRVMIATIVSKAEQEAEGMQGYMAMLAVDSRFRNRGIGSKLSKMGIRRMVEAGCTEIVLETEASNSGALSLYQRLVCPLPPHPHACAPMPYDLTHLIICLIAGVLQGGPHGQVLPERRGRLPAEDVGGPCGCSCSRGP